jgi:1-acyl-sn-glycerol-3-phosphate acyltransferase
MARRIFNWWLRFAYRLLLRLRIEGREHVPAEGPVILMINHISFLDPFVVVASTPREVTAMSKIENFRIPFWGLVFKLYGAIPVRRGQADRRAIRWALKELREGTMLLMAPEGTRSPNKALQPGQGGLAYIGHRSGAAIVPVAITGTEHFTAHIKRLKRTPVSVRLGQPFFFQAPGNRLDREVLSQMTDEAMYRLAALLPPAYRGSYGDLERATQDYIQPANTRAPALQPHDTRAHAPGGPNC